MPCPASRACKRRENGTAPKAKELWALLYTGKSLPGADHHPVFLVFSIHISRKTEVKNENHQSQRFYAALYNHDAFYDVPDEVAELLILFKRREKAQRRRIYRNRAYYSLDHDNCIEKQALCLVPSAETMYQSFLERETLATALSRLTPKQQLRIYQHFALEMNYLQIAKAEGVCESSARRSVDAGIRKLKILLCQ